MRHAVFVLASSLSLLTAGSALAAEIPVKEVSSNSVYVDREKGITYSAENMLDSKSGSMWVEGESSSGLGKYVEFKFDGDQEIHSFKIWAGCFVDNDFWKRHNRIHQIELKYPDFTSEKIELKDVEEGQLIKLAEAKTVSKIKLYLRAVHNGTTWNDTPITRIQFFDKNGPTELDPAGATATSEYDDKDHAYGPKKLVDGWEDSYWVNGEGSGEGESVTVDLGGSKTLTKFGIASGWGDTESFFKGSNRAAEIEVDFGGSKKTFSLKDEPGMQVFDLEGVAASSVKVTFTKVTKGESHDDLYIGELRFWE
ncbi:MAG: hypothetical protein KDA24_15070 [Deltaproteobacteria bacterium]|nr:hypothetical protein [Deltaproteobacteria bacterium]